MARPARHANPSQVLSPSRTFFVTTKTSMGRALLQSERNATLLIDVLRSYVAGRKFQLHDFVVMPDHVHLLITVGGDMTIERAMQFVKGGFSFRLRKESGYLREVWQRGFSEVRVDDRELSAISGLHCREPGEGGASGFTGGVSVLLHLFGKTKGGRG